MADAGDSNWRIVFRAIDSYMRHAGFLDVARSPPVIPGNEMGALCAPGLEERCCPKWFDRDIIFALPRGGRFRISFRFVICAELRLALLEADWSKVHQCCERRKGDYIGATGPQGSYQICNRKKYVRAPDAEFQSARWKRPHMLVFAHGLWNVAEFEHWKRWPTCQIPAGQCITNDQKKLLNKKQIKELRNVPRHTFIARTLGKLQKSGVHVRWASNFPNNGGPGKVKHADLLQDAKCHFNASNDTGISNLNVWQRTSGKESLTVAPKSYHFLPEVAEQLVAEIFDSYLGCKCS